jgi:hypothetical protein
MVISRECRRFIIGTAVFLSSLDLEVIYSLAGLFVPTIPRPQYLVEHFLERWGRTLNGAVEWKGENAYDVGVIYARDNRIEAGS